MDDDQSAKPEDLKSSIPKNFPVTFRGFNEEYAKDLNEDLAFIFHEFGKVIDISRLDGLTVATDYDAALAELDRGYKSVQRLEKSTEYAEGVAMTPSVLREDGLKSHIVINGSIVTLLKADDRDDVKLALHTIAHECSHVEVTAAYNACFPNELLQSRHGHVLDFWRWDVIFACWDEYAVCRIAGDMSHDPLASYEATFVAVLNDIDAKVLRLVKGFHGGNANDLVGPVTGAYGDLMKFACYMLGALAGTDRSLKECQTATNALKGHWFNSYIQRLDEICGSLFDQFGKWPNKGGFEKLGSIVEEIIADRVMKIVRNNDQTYRMYILPHVQIAAKFF
jgi:hypothetical protein